MQFIIQQFQQQLQHYIANKLEWTPAAQDALMHAMSDHGWGPVV